MIAVVDGQMVGRSSHESFPDESETRGRRSVSRNLATLNPGTRSPTRRLFIASIKE